MKKIAYIFLMFLVSVILLNLSLTAGEIRTIARNHEYVQLKGYNFEQFANEQVPIDQLYLYAYRAGANQWEPIPFQFDELDTTVIGTDTTLSYFPLDNHNGLLDKRDEFVFMIRDFGDEANTDLWIDDASASENPRYQIVVTDTLNGEEKKGWVYLFRSTNSLVKSTKRYVEYNPELDKVSSSNYEIAYNDEGNLIDFAVKPEGGGAGNDFLNKNQFRYSGKLFGLPFEWSDESLVKDTSDYVSAPIEYKNTGPIRVIRLLHTRLLLEGLASFPIPFTSWYYSTFYRFSKKVPIEDVIKTELIRLSFNLDEDAIGMKFFSSDSTGEFTNQNIPIDGVGENDGIVDSLSRKKPFWTMATGNPGTIYTLNDVNYLGNENYSWRLYYLDDMTGEENAIGDHGVIFTAYKLNNEIQSKNNVFLLPANFPVDSARILFANYNAPTVRSIHYQMQTSVATEEDGTLPKNFKLHPTYPNPFNALTTISFDLPSRENVRLDIFNIQGSYVTTLTDKKFAAGFHQLQWDGRNSSGALAGSGVYFIKIKTDRHFATVKTILLK